jgi:hypothetical protein
VARADVHANLQVRYHLDEGTLTTANDSSTNTGRNGTLTNDAAFNSGGRVGGCVELDGAADYVNCPNITQTDAASQLTIAFWLKTNQQRVNDAICGKVLNDNNLFIIHLGSSSEGGSNDIAVAIHQNGTNSYVYTNSDVIPNGVWVHVAVVFNGALSGGNDCKVYINGVSVETLGPAAFPDILHTDTDVTTGDWYIGTRRDRTDLAVDGQIDEFHLYTRALSASDVQELYFQSDGSILFNGALANPNAKLENTTADVPAGSNEMTICAWVYPIGQGESGFGTVVALPEGGNHFRLEHASGANLRFAATFDSGGTWTFPVANAAWTAVAVSYSYSSSDSDPIIRVNFQNTSPTESSPSGVPDDIDTGYCVGNRTGQANTWAGRIAHVQVFNRLLSAAEMDGCLKKPGSVKQNLRLWLPMTSASDTADQSGNGFNGTGTALETANDPPYDPRYRFGVTDETIGQLVIRPNGTEPALGVRGVGSRSKLAADGSLDDGARLITTEAWGIANTQVIEPTVRDIYLDGNQGFTSRPTESGDPVCHAIAIDGDAAEVTGCKVFDFAGDGIRVNNSIAEAQPLIRMPRVRDNKIAFCYTGIHADAVDSQISGNRVANVRDYCLLVGAGNVQSDGNHYFGASTAIKVESGAGAFRSVNDTFSDAAYGFENTVESQGSQIGDGFTQHCWLRNILCRAETSISNTVVRVARTSTQHSEVIGVEFSRNGGTDASRSSFIGGTIWMSDHTFQGDTNPNGSTAGMKISAYRTNVNTAIVGNSIYGNEKGVWVPSEILGGTFYIKATGFQQSGDVIVDIDSATIKETTWVIECAEGDTAISIPAGWDDSNSFTIVRETKNKTILTPGKAY